jgi:hypothetical protein
MIADRAFEKYALARLLRDRTSGTHGTFRPGKNNALIAVLPGGADSGNSA